MKNKFKVRFYNGNVGVLAGSQSLSIHRDKAKVLEVLGNDLYEAVKSSVDLPVGSSKTDSIEESIRYE